MFFGKGLRLCRITGITISLDYSWFLIFALFVYLIGAFIFPRTVHGLPALWNWSLAVFTSLLFFSSVLLHEMSHAFVARRNGIPINNITLFILGGVAQMEDEPGTAMIEFKMAIAGPIASVLIGIAFYALFLAARQFHAVALTASQALSASFIYLSVINITLAIFNLLPAYPMDGGRVFRSILWGAMRDLRRATQIASVTGQTFGWILIVYGVGGMLYPPLRPYSSIWLALVGWFIISAARSSYQQVLMKDTLSHVPITEVMNNQVDAVQADISVDHLVSEYFMRESASVLPVERNGQLLGMVSVEDVKKLPRERWATTLVSDITPPVSEEQVLHPQDDAWDAANQMSRENRDRLLVTDDHAHVEGIVTRGAILRWLQTHTNWAEGSA